MKFSKFSKIFYTEDALSYPLTKKIFKQFPDAKRICIPHPSRLYFKPWKEIEKISQSKENLFLTTRKENFIDKCPGSKGHLCCNYFVTKNVIGCPKDCTYCYLQAYINISAITIFVNEENFLKEFEEFAKTGLKRIGTGEFSDSFFLDEILDINTSLIEIVSKTNSILELKTKSSCIDKILNLKHRGKTVVAWSINPEEIILKEEPHTASLKQRIDAMQKCIYAGYKIALHLDPIIYSENWRKNYEEMLMRVFEKINPSKVEWISLGTFRFYPVLKRILVERFDGPQYIFGEFIRCDDGKMRYPRFLREEIYRHIKNLLLKINRNLRIYLCMESETVWKNVFGKSPFHDNNLEILFGKR
ncbi:MAG: hypothetical protein J7L42_03330 [Elusimicrobia bacterium]|nr:hypothetical protein [Elusimicrobiota bacterium]